MDRSQPRYTASNDKTGGRAAYRPNDQGDARQRGEQRQGEETFRLFVDQVAEYAIFRLDPAGRVVSWNRGAERIKGYRKEEILGRHVSAFYIQEDAEAGVPECVLEAAAREGEWAGEGWRVRKGGERFWAHVTITALEGEEGALRGFAKVTRDLTERREQKEALREREKSLRESERRYRRLFEGAQEAIAVSTPEGTIVDVNSAAEVILGYSRKELLAMNAVEFYIDPKERERGKELMAADGAVRDFEARMRRKDGEEIVCEITSTARYGKDGKAEAYQTFLRDVTERKQAEKALRESEERFRVLAEKAPVGVALLQGGVYRYVNLAFARIAGYQPEELFGRSPELLFHPDDWPAVRGRVAKRLEGAVREVHYRARVQTKEGQIRRVEVHGSRITYRGAPAIIGTMMDVTERRRMQREILRVQEEERRRIGQDLHDGVASQLTGIAMLLSTLARRIQAAEVKDADEGEAIASQAEEIQALVLESGQDVRGISRGLVPAGLSGKEFPTALERLAENVEGGRFERSVEGLPKLSDETAAHLYWIAQEATANAQRYAEADEIVVQLRRAGNALILEVEDDGEGFDVEKVDRGGLGLRTMRYRAELVGAAFSIDTAPGEGTRVRCCLTA